MSEGADAKPGPDVLVAVSRRVNHVRLDYPDLEQVTVDVLFLAYLLECGRFGRFEVGPVSIDVRVVEDRFARSYARIAAGQTGKDGYDASAKRFFERLMSEVSRSGRRRIDELHWLLAFMRTDEGLPSAVFGELGVSPEQVELFASRGPIESNRAPDELLSPEEVAEYLRVHVQTVRAWIRSGKLPASRLAGQRALRVRRSDLGRVLEPVDPADFE